MKASAKNNLVILTAVSMSIFASSAMCVPFDLNIFNNDGYNGDPNFILSVEVTDPGSKQVDFKIKNDSLLDSIITQILIDDGLWLKGIGSLTEPAGVAFDHPAQSENLPGGNLLSPPFVTSTGLSADRESGQGGVNNGINPGEYLIITFDLQPGKTFTNVIDAVENGDIRIGVHIQNLPKREGCSDSASAVTPEPMTIMILTAGMLGLRRRLNK
jgi:hypothetical protein